VRPVTDEKVKAKGCVSRPQNVNKESESGRGASDHCTVPTPKGPDWLPILT
jgi:hypothetical protein